MGVDGFVDTGVERSDVISNSTILFLFFTRFDRALFWLVRSEARSVGGRREMETGVGTILGGMVEGRQKVESSSGTEVEQGSTLRSTVPGVERKE